MTSLPINEHTDDQTFLLQAALWSARLVTTASLFMTCKLKVSTWVTHQTQSKVFHDLHERSTTTMSCQDCFSGYQHDGKPRGAMVKFHGLDTYIVEPPGARPAKAIIVIISDAFGFQFVNSQLLADTYATKGDYRVYLPDFMNGQPLLNALPPYYLLRPKTGHSCPSWFLDTMKALVAPGNYLSKPQVTISRHACLEYIINTNLHR